MGLLKEARKIYAYYEKHPEEIIIKNKKEEIEEEIEKSLNRLRKKGIIIKTIKKQ